MSLSLGFRGSDVEEEKRQEAQPAGPKLRARELAFTSGAPPCLAGRRNEKRCSEQNNSHDGKRTLLGRAMLGTGDASAGPARRHKLLPGQVEPAVPTLGL